MTIVGATTSSRDALKHLRAIKPNDGWSIQVQTFQNGDVSLRLLRRGVPLTDGFFADIHHNPQTNTVVGLLTKDASACQILVDGQTGRPVLQKTIGHVSCSNSYPGYRILTKAEQEASSAANQEGRGSFVSRPGSSSRSATSSRSSARSRSSAAGSATPNNNNDAAPANPFENMSEEDKQFYMKYATMGLGALIAYKVLANVLGEGLLFFLVLPGVYLYGVSTCPTNASFDAKKEVKRVLRGHHLPDDHPSKPRRGNFLEEWTAKISASVATEVSAAAGGYSTEIAPLLGGCAKHATVTLPTLGLTCEWIGFNETWYHYRTYTPESQQATTRR